ncbi:MAG TPA: hypothetical protein VN721_00690 [Flavipsychrobacter sp.]|nr:hypothetical protein [Flavipsychrobacter sp.]
MSEVKDIFPPGGGQGKLPEDKLMAYLEGKLSLEEQHEVEQWLADEGMESDAMDGLKQIEPGQAKMAVDKINHQLRKHLTSKKRARRQIKDNKWALVAIVVILLLIVVVYVVIKMSLKK